MKSDIPCAGEYSFNFDILALKPGVYFYRFQFIDYITTGKLILFRYY